MSSQKILGSQVHSIGPPIAQSTFDEIILENIEDLDMEAEEAVQDAIEQLNTQKANMLYIIREKPDFSVSADDNNNDTKVHKCVGLSKNKLKMEYLDQLVGIKEGTTDKKIDISPLINNQDFNSLLVSLVDELKTDNLPKRYQACKIGDLHNSVENILTGIGYLPENENESESSKNLDSFLNNVLNLAYTTFENQPDFASRQTLHELAALINKVSDENLYNLLRLIAVVSTKHEKNRVNLYHSGFFTNLDKFLSKKFNTGENNDDIRLSSEKLLHNKILGQLCRTLRRFCVDDDPRETSVRAHDNARDLVNDANMLERLCRFLEKIDNNNFKLKKEIIMTLSKLLVRNEFCLKAADQSCGLLELIESNLQICVSENEEKDAENNANANAQGDGATPQEIVLLKPLLILLKAVCGNDEVKYRVSQNHQLCENIIENGNKFGTDANIAEAVLACSHVITLRQPEMCEFFAKLSIAHTCINLMELHKDQRKVMLNGCMLIRNMVARTRHLQKSFLELDVESLLNEICVSYKMDTNVLQAARAAQRDLDLDANLSEQWRGQPGQSHEIAYD